MTKIRTRLTKFPSYKEAQALVVGLRTSQEYMDKRIELGLPSNPNKHYSEWTSWKDFLDHETHGIINKKFMSYDEAKDLVRNSGVRNPREYSDLRVLHPALPYRPYHTYRKNWGGWAVFLGSPSKLYNKVHVSYDKARKIVLAHRIERTREYYALSHVMRRLYLPTHLHKHYHKEWKSWKEFIEGKSKKRQRFHKLKGKPQLIAA